MNFCSRAVIPKLTCDRPVLATRAKRPATSVKLPAKLLVKKSTKGTNLFAKTIPKLVAKSNTLVPNAPNFSAVVGIVVLTAANFLLPSAITLLTKA